ncbi:VWA domain-containing protein [Streptomyces sp. NPDC092296]|uniref:VWA domain-containing protein n=1 Tax=Streptomyces sp. NPDC092296 TaxID=3366012 RepID=UPI0037F1295B
MSAADGREPGGPTVTLTISQDKYLPAGPGSGEVQAVLTVTTGGLRAAPEAAAEVLVVDCSGSMGWPRSKIEAAREATTAAIGLLRDGTRFAVVEGTDRARTVYPPTGYPTTAHPPTAHPTTDALAVAGPDTRAEAITRVRRLNPGGGTAIGSWLTLARELLDQRPAALRHVLLLTDGKNETESPGRLAQVLDACEGHFTCDARGIGDGWDAQELHRIATRLHGTADVVLRDADLTADFTAAMRIATARALPELRIRLTRLPGTTVRYLKQVFPAELDLTADGRPVDDRSTEFTTRAWGNEIRQYQVCLAADPTHRPRGEDLQIAVAELAAADPLPLPAPVPVLVHWTDGHQPSTGLNPVVSHFGDYGELGRAAAAAYQAHQTRDLPAAEAALDRVLRLAHLLDDRAMLELLAHLLRSTDPAAGPARLRQRYDERHFGRLLLLSSRSTRMSDDGLPQAAPSEPPGPNHKCPDHNCPDRNCPDRNCPDRICPRCAAPAPPGARFCPDCGRPMDGDPRGGDPRGGDTGDGDTGDGNPR